MADASSVMVTMNDVRAAHMCSRGCRTFCERHGIEWATFLRVGVSVARLEEIGDDMALRAADIAMERAKEAEEQALQAEGGVE